MHWIRTGRQKPPVRVFFLAAVLLVFSSPLRCLPDAADAMLGAAIRLELSQDPYWRSLLYYEKNWLGRPYSPCLNSGFFVSPGGKTDPEAEMAAEIAGFSYQGLDDESPECMFPERYRWLRERLGVDPAVFPPRRCRVFENWREGLSPESVSLLFAAGYLNNPSTLYGHTFLRLHRKGGGGADLLDYTINYAATADALGGVLFALKGLVGAYPGQFSTIPYYLKIQEYHNTENRDLWEFPLGLSQDEIDRLLRHSWELGKAAFPYLFFTRNCSWQLMPLLDIVRPGGRLSGKFRFWVIPSDTAKAALAFSPGAVPVWRPSLWKVVEWKRAQLSDEEKKLAADLSRGDQAGAMPAVRNLPPPRRAAVLETAADYLSWRFYAGRIDKGTLDARSDPLLEERAGLGGERPFSGGPSRPVSIVDAHESLRLGLGLVSLKKGPAWELRGRFAVQDLLDDPAGYLPDAALEMGAFRLRYSVRYNRVYFKEARLARVTSLNPWDSWVRRPSWEIAAGVEQADEAGRQEGRNAVWAMSAASGIAAEAPGPFRQLWYAMAVADSAMGPALRYSWRAGGGAKAGLLAEAGPARILAEARYCAYAAGDPRPLWTGILAAGIKTGRDSALRAEYAWRGGTKEAGVYYHRFIFPP